MSRGYGAEVPVAFRGALRLLPPDLRQEFGAEMEADLGRVLAGAAAGRLVRMGLTLRAVADVVYRAPAEWRAELRSRRHEARSGRGSRWPGGGGVRQAVRSLVRRPGFTVAAVATLGLGIGSSLALWTVVESVLLRPLPFPDSDRIVTVRHSAPGIDLPDLGSSTGTVQLYRDLARTVGLVAAMEGGSRNVSGGAEPVRMEGRAVTPELFEVLGAMPALGRSFRAEDAQASPPRVAILTDAAWRSSFGGDAGVIGTTVRIDGEPAEIVGVMPPEFFIPGQERTELLVPLYLSPARGATTFGLDLLMRLAPGATVEAARAEVEAIQSQIPEYIPELTQDFLERAQWSVSVRGLRDFLVESVATTLWVLLGTVAVVLLIAFANVANLVLVRSEGRRREMAVRSALGASRLQIAGTFLTETLLLSVAGGALGLLLAVVAVRVLVARGPVGLPRLAEVSIDGSVIVLAVALSVAIGFLLALLPLAHGLLRERASALRDGSIRSTTGREGRRVRSGLIAAQVGLATVLLIFAGLLVRSSLALAAVDAGVRRDGVVTIGVSRGSVGDAAAQALFYGRLREEIAGLPSVRAVGAGSYIPFVEGSMNGSSFEVESKPRAEDDLPVIAMYITVMEGYFEALGMRVLEGRTVQREDRGTNPNVVWINQTMADRFLDGDAVGQRIRFSSDDPWLYVAGVVNDVRTFGLDEPIRPMAYLPITTPVRGTSLEMMHFAVEADAAPGAIASAVRDIVRRLDPSVPLTTTMTMETVISRSLARRSFALALLSLAAATALLLGIIGLYGVISYIVAQRTREIGVRVALGADIRRVRRWVLGQGLVLVGFGVAVGLIAAAASTRVMQAMLYEVNARDPLTFAATPLILLVVGVLATWIPAVRASNVSPLEALRGE